MASLLAPGMYRCYYCQFESTENAFKYFDNKKVDQPRHQCHYCHKLFTVGSHGRPQGRTYAKKRNEDPPELKNLSRQCRHCGVADNALFKYYNNRNHLQPRFKCLSCGKQFQMRLMGTGDETRLVHTSCNQRQATGRCRKPSVPEAFTNATDFGEASYQPSDGSFMPVPFDPLMPLDTGARLLPECCEEDVQYSSFLEAELTDENESPNADPISCNANVDDGLLPELSAEDAECLALLESELSTNENERAPNADPISCTLNVDDGLPPAWCAEDAESLAILEVDLFTDGNEGPNADTSSSTANVDDGLPPWSDNDAELVDFEFVEAGVRVDESDDAEMVSDIMTDMHSDCTSNAEVESGPMLVETLAPAQSDSWSNDTIEDPSSLNYLEAAEACCKLMDMETLAAAQSDSWSNDTIEDPSSQNYLEAAAACCKLMDMETLAPAQSDSWSNDTIEVPSNQNYLEAAAACCKLMDMAHSVPVAPVQLGESSSSSAGLTTSEPYSFQRDLMEEDQSSVGDWNEGQEEEDDMEMSPWS